MYNLKLVLLCTAALVVAIAIAVVAHPEDFQWLRQIGISIPEVKENSTAVNAAKPGFEGEQGVQKCTIESGFSLCAVPTFANYTDRMEMHITLEVSSEEMYAMPIIAYVQNSEGVETYSHLPDSVTNVGIPPQYNFEIPDDPQSTVIGLVVGTMSCYPENDSKFWQCKP